MDTAKDNGFEELLATLRSTGKKYNIEKITAAYEYARSLHEGQFRASGEPYISHPVAVANIVAGLELDTDSICAALLHDTVEDCSDKTNLKALEKKFGADVAALVDGLTKIKTMQVGDKEEEHIENLRKMLLATSRDIRVIFIKLCDRLHNMRTLSAKSDDRQRVIALETMQVYAPLAHRLGMQKIKQELETLGIMYLDPIGYKEVTDDAQRRYGQTANFLEKIKEQISESMTANHIHFTLEGRVKSAYSIYKKMYTQHKSFDEIYDFYAFRIIVDTELECYTALGLIHEMFNSVPGRFKDYISTPKPNMYRSLHTTVIGKDGIPFEVQIRTWEMHQFAEYGVAAHWKYKSGATSKEEMDKKLRWVSELIQNESETKDPDEFMSALKTDIFRDEVFVFTPKGDVISLVSGATVIDFAYAIHSAVGDKMIGAKVNGVIVPIASTPKNGDIVEIITSNASKGPSRDWLNIVKTSEARSKIRQWFKKEKRTENIQVGRGLVDSELSKYAKSFTDDERDAIVADIIPRIGFSSAEDLYNTLGYGGMSISRISSRLKDEYERMFKPAETQTAAPAVPVVQTKERPKHMRSNSGIVVDGEYGCEVKFAKCCNPLPGDDVIGFITKGYGISIHKRNCPNVVAGMLQADNVNRFVTAYWDTQNSGGSAVYEALLQMYCEDKMGVLAAISGALADMKVDIMGINSQKNSAGKMIINLKVACRDSEHYALIVSRLRGIDGVMDINRGIS